MKITYETETCSRCDGSGAYSFNLKDGTRCYGCGGSGRKMTRAGKAAHKAIADAKIAHFTLPASKIEPGMIVKRPGGRKFHTVVSVEPDSLNGGRIKIRFKNGSGFNALGLMDVTRGWSKAEFAEILLPIAKRRKGAIVTE